MDGLSVIKETIGRPSFTTTYVGFDAGSIRDIPNPTGPTGPTGLFMTFGQGETETLHVIDSGQFNPTDNALPFTKFGFFWNGVLIFGMEVASILSATFCGINNDKGDHRLGRWTWIENDDYRKRSLQDDRLPRRKINLYDTHTENTVAINVGLSDVTYVNSPIYDTPPWFCPIHRDVVWVGKPAINMFEFDWFISVLLDHTVLPSCAPASDAAPVDAAAMARETAEAVKTIFGDDKYMNDQLDKYEAEYQKLPHKDKKCNKDGNFSESVIGLKSKRKTILDEKKYRVELLNRIGKIILLMKDYQPLLHFYELWLEMMKKTMSIDVPNIPLFQNTSSRKLDFDDVGDVGREPDDRPICYEYPSSSWRSSQGSSSSRPKETSGLPWWTATETYESKYGSIPIEDKNKLCRANTDEIKDKLNKLYHSTDFKEVKSLVNNKKLLLGVHPDHNIGCNGLSTAAFKELQELREYIVKLPSSAGGRRSKRIRRKSRKVLTGCSKSRQRRYPRRRTARK